MEFYVVSAKGILNMQNQNVSIFKSYWKQIGKGLKNKDIFMYPMLGGSGCLRNEELQNRKFLCLVVNKFIEYNIK